MGKDWRQPRWAGTARSTPALDQVVTDWPRPWFFLRQLGSGLLVLPSSCFAFQAFENPTMVPGLIIVGAFFVPLACVALFFEFNVLRNISLYQVLKFIVAGGIASMVIALFLFSTTKLGSFLGAILADIVEEIAKVLAAVVLLRGAQQYRY